jgi:hypothetical protein
VLEIVATAHFTVDLTAGSCLTIFAEHQSHSNQGDHHASER